MEKIYEKVKKYIAEHQMIAQGDCIVAGVSGGADSICMLYMLQKLSKELGFQLFAVHVHHGVREEADADAAYVEKVCKELGVPFYLRKVDMMGYAKEKGLSPEEAGRQLRYQAFAEIPDRGFHKIAVAHHNNDRAETLLFHLFRGSGLRGLGSIRPVRGQVIRPLLCLDRTEIEACLSEKNIAYCIDSTNDEDAYTRNKIRHHILPFVETQICQNATRHIGDAAQILAETEDFVQMQTALAYERCVVLQGENKDGIVLDLSKFQKEDSFLQKRILLQCLEKLTPYRKDITKEHIRALLQIIGGDGSKEVSLPYHLIARKEYEKLTIYRGKEDVDKAVSGEKPQQVSYPVSVPGDVLIPGLGMLEFQSIEREDFLYQSFFEEKGQIIPGKTYTKWFDYDKITTVLLVRTRQTGDYLMIDRALHRKSIKEYMIHEKIPRLQRDSMYLLADGAHVLWIPGYRISQYYKVDENTKRILQVRLRGG
ncbi:MAG: tRNA lysidine(34) synthetase TilS [Muribaculaceae bacterium]|nr:tRNA lysidine(34) synthetase TilS [Muribaculaceae bacterium]